MFGAYFGLIVKAQLYKGMTKYKDPESSPRVKMIVRALVSVLVSCPLLLTALVVTINNIWAQTALNTVGALSFGFVIFGFADELNLRLALFDRGNELRGINVWSTEI